MQHDQHIMPHLHATRLAQVCGWAQELVQLHARLAPRFARPEPHQRALLYLQGILSETARKNGWQLAEHAGEGRPDGMQRLLSEAVWDTDGVRDDLRTYALEQLGQESAILVIDESGFRQQWQEVGRGRPAVLRNDWAGGELPGGRLSRVCNRPWPCPH